MTSPHRELSERIRGESEDLDRLVGRVVKGWQLVQKGGDPDGMYLDSVALNLHGFYSGLESLFRLVARNIDGSLPDGGDWHKVLLEQVTREKADTRPAVIDVVHVPKLDELRCFRHLVRNVYTFNLIPERIENLVVGLSDLWRQLSPELLAFADFLSQVAIEEEANDPPLR